MPLLHAKQVVFFFIAATVSVVGIFLCGVQVGRGVPLGGGPMTSGLAVAGHSEDHLPPATVSSRRSKLSAAATESAELTYYRRLDRGEPQLERLRSAPNAESPDGAGAANREDAAAPHARGEGVTSPDAVVETATRASMPSGGCQSHLGRSAGRVLSAGDRAAISGVGPAPWRRSWWPRGIRPRSWLRTLTPQSPCGWRITSQPRNPVPLSSSVILGEVARISRCATCSSGDGGKHATEKRKMVRPAGFESATLGLEGRGSHECERRGSTRGSVEEFL